MANWKPRKRAALAGAQNWRCAYCQGAMDVQGDGPRVATIEHVTAQSRGGPQHRDNLVVACRACNGARPPHHDALQFFELRQVLLGEGLWPECTPPGPRVAGRLWRRRSLKFTLEEVFDHIEQHHPGCPSVFRNELAHRVSGRRWGDAPLGMAFGITATAFVRDTFTDYQRLRLVGMTDTEARLAVRSDVAGILESWRPSDP